MSQVCECNEVYIHVTVCNLRVCTYIFYLNVQPSWLINWTLVNHLNARSLDTQPYGILCPVV